MIKHAFFVLAAGVTLAACQPAIPDSGRGAGFDNFAAEQRKRDAASDRHRACNAGDSGNADPDHNLPSDPSAAATAAETARVLAATRPGVPNSGACADQCQPDQPAARSV